MPGRHSSARRRQAQVGQRGVLEYHLDPETIDTVLWVDELEDGASHDWLVEQVEALPEKERLIVEGLFWARKGRCQLARELGINRRTVNRRLERAMERLRAQAQDQL